jgi:hypothetical protein
MYRSKIHNEVQATMKCNKKAIVTDNINELNRSLTPSRLLATSPLSTCREGQSEHRELGVSQKKR